MRTTILAALAALLALAASPVHASFTQDDRYFDSRAPAAQKHVKERRVAHKTHAPARKVAPRKWRNRPVPVPRSRPGTVRDYRQDVGTFDAVPIWNGAVREVERAVVLGGRPSGAPPRWCGFWLGRHLGLYDRKLWLARNWAHVGAPAVKQPGVIVVWRHHVGKITAVRADGAIKVLSGNDGRAVRDRWRSARGVIAYRML